MNFIKPIYRIEVLAPGEQETFLKFINNLCIRHWPLTSLAYQREPNKKDILSLKTQLKNLVTDKHSSILLLKKNDILIASIRISNDLTDPQRVVFSHVETHPDFQKRGIFGLTLGNACLRMACESDCKRVELTTWTFNRKGIPLYKRGGFRAVPGTSLLMENYLPSIVKHPDAKPYFERHDYIRTLQNKRSYGYDAIEVNGLSVFEYRWNARKTADELRVLVDWQKKEIVDIKCNVERLSTVAGEISHV